MRLAIKTALCAVAVSLTLSTPPSASAALPAKACDLMTRQTATAIYGRPVAAGRYEMATAGMSDCRFDCANGGFAEIGLIDPASMNMTGPALFKLSVTSQSAGQTSETLSGLGEGACLRTGSEEVNLFILYHGIILELTSDKGATAGPALKAALIQAARVAIAKF